MFSPKIELNNANKIVINSNVHQLMATNLDFFQREKGYDSLELIINIQNPEELTDLIKSNLGVYNDFHFKLNLPSINLHQFDVDLIFENFVVKSIMNSDNYAQFLLFKPKKIHTYIEKNNYKIFDKFSNDKNQEWNPIYNTFNESLKLNGDLTDELNRTVRDNKELKTKFSTIKDIISKV